MAEDDLLCDAHYEVVSSITTVINDLFNQEVGPFDWPAWFQAALLFDECVIPCNYIPSNQLYNLAGSIVDKASKNDNPIDFYKYKGEEKIFDRIKQWRKNNEHWLLPDDEKQWLLPDDEKQWLLPVDEEQLSQPKDKDSGIEISSRLVLAALALSNIEGEDAIDIVLENCNNLFSLVAQIAQKYLKKRLIKEEDQNLKKIIEKTLEDLKPQTYIISEKVLEKLRNNFENDSN